MDPFVFWGLIFLAVVFTPIWLMFRHYLAKGKYEDSPSGFSQANVSLDYGRGTITLGHRSFPVDRIRGLRWESGYGEHANISHGIIELNDMSYPVHKVEFIRPSDAERFVTRLQMALSRVNQSAAG